MGDIMYTISNDTISEIVINKSSFIALLYKVYNEEDISIKMNEIKNKYKDATHYCYGYIIGNCKRFSDDKEPSKTAGLPILNVLESNNLDNVLCVVVRYFGGIKLGTGGLVRAYTKSVTEALKNTNLCELVDGKELIIYFNYDRIKIIDNLLKNTNIKEKTFSDKTIYKVLLSNIEYDNIIEKLRNNILDIKVNDNITIEKAIN